MTDRDAQEPRPDVEAIIAEIREAVRASELTVPAGAASSAESDGDLKALLADANRGCAVGLSRPGGVRGLLYRVILRAMGPLVAEVSRFNGLSVRLFNKLDKMLSGNDTATESDLLAQTRRRIDLLTDLGKRLDTYDTLELDARLKRIEQRLSDLQGQEKA